MNKVGELLAYPPGSMRFWEVMRDHCEGTLRHDEYGKAAEVQPPWDFETWEALLDQAVELGVAAVIVDDPSKPPLERKIVDFAGPFGAALLKRYRWLQDAKEHGLTPTQAEAKFNVVIDRERSEARHREKQEATDRKRRRDEESAARKSSRRGDKDGFE
jgi:hypothetical protein